MGKHKEKELADFVKINFTIQFSACKLIAEYLHDNVNEESS